MSKRASLLANAFWANVVPGRADECWVWRGTITEHGYGRLEYLGRPWRAHRLSLFIATGKLPNVAMHLCDNRPCVNPAHLRDGTHGENNDDMRSKKREGYVWGDTCGKSKLTGEQAADIRLRYRRGEKQAELASKFGVTQQTISRVVNGRTWVNRRGGA